MAMCGEFRRKEGSLAALKRTVGSLRALAFPQLLRKMSAQGYLQQVERKRANPALAWDPFHFISHPQYLIRGYSFSQRFEAALYHFDQEAAAFDDTLLNRLYSGQGFVLWEDNVDGHQFHIHLCQAREEVLEGDLCLQLIADGGCILTMHFVWSDGATFGQEPGPTIFITRNQTRTLRELAVFRECFKQNSPPYFCLAALSGLGLACGLKNLYGVQCEAQMSYVPTYASSFRNSYDEFWEKFNGQRVVPHAYRMPLPLQVRDLSELKSKRRGRAEMRRRAWGEVSQSAAAAIAKHLRRPVNHAPVAPAVAVKL